MEETLVIEICRQALWVLIKISGPILMVALIIGLLVSLFQALTQIQEMTLSFVPKVLAIAATLIFTMPFILHTLSDFTESLAERIVTPQPEE